MTATVLDRVREGDLASVREAVKQLSEADRRRLSGSAGKLLREVRVAYFGLLTDKRWTYGGDSESVLHSAQVLLLATATPAELRKAGQWGVPPDELALEVLTDRNPPSLAKIVDVIADETPGRWISRFGLMRALVRAGLLEPPANPGYVLAMISGLQGRNLSVYEALKADRGLLEDEVWRLFAVEGGGDTSLASHDKYCPETLAWDWALTQLCADGLLSRDRLLDVSLEALRRDFAAFRAGWFSRFHERLQPTRDERRTREADYLALVSSPISATVSFAVRALTRAGGVSEELSDRLAPALDAKAVGTVKAASRLLPKSPRGAELAARALAGGSRESQGALLAFIEKVGAREPAITALVARAAPNIAPSLQDQVRSFLGAIDTVPPDSPPSAVFPRTAAQEPRSASEVSGPVESIPELIELLATVLERVDDVHDIERAIEGVSRLCDRTPDTIRRLEPIAKRARKLASTRYRAPFSGISPRADVAGLALAWWSGQAPALLPIRGSRNADPSVPPTMPHKSVLGFLSYRVLEVATRAARGSSQPLLSLPTGRGGSIDPKVLATRRAECKRLRIRPGEADAIQAALRGGEISPSRAIRFEFGTEVTSHSYRGRSYTHVHFQVRVHPPYTIEPSLDDVPGLFLAALSGRGFGYCGVSPDRSSGLPEAVRWVSTVWPANREPYYARGAAGLGRNIDWGEASWHNRHFLEPLLLHAEPIGEMATLLLALGLGAKEPGERGLAADALIVTVRDGRLDLAALGATLARLYDEQVVKGARLALSLADAGRVSNRHAEAIATLIEHVLAGLHGPPPADLHSLLGCLSDLLPTVGRGLRLPGARAYLLGVEGSGKAAAAARALTG